MPDVMRALGLAFADAARPRMLALMLVPALAAILLWSVAAWVYWGTWIRWFADAMAANWFVQWSGSWGEWVLSSASVLLVLALLVPAMIVTALLVSEVFVMPLVLRSVQARHYPMLARNGFGTAWGSFVNAAVSGMLFLVIWLATLPLWLTGVGAVLLPALNSAYLNTRIFRYDALSEHANVQEYAAIRRRAGGRLYSLGLVLGVLYYVPMLNLIAPVLSALAYTHFCLDQLARLRSAQRR
jgi:hypothetical protein